MNNKLNDINDPIKSKSFLFAIRIVNLYKYLSVAKNEWVLSKQLLRSGINPGAMIRESKNTESGNDFIHKLSIAQKELDETQYWLELLFETKYIYKTEFDSINADATELMKIIRSSILTKKKNLKQIIKYYKIGFILESK
jgi:four helix bundle protein